MCNRAIANISSFLWYLYHQTAEHSALQCSSSPLQLNSSNTNTEYDLLAFTCPMSEKLKYILTTDDSYTYT